VCICSISVYIIVIHLTIEYVRFQVNRDPHAMLYVCMLVSVCLYVTCIIIIDTIILSKYTNDAYYSYTYDMTQVNRDPHAMLEEKREKARELAAVEGERSDMKEIVTMHKVCMCMYVTHTD
jgi:hypothetical protein